MRRRWPLRLLQFSPLAMLALMTAIWFTMPPEIRLVDRELRAWRSVPDLPIRDPEHTALSRLVERESMRETGVIDMPEAEPELDRVVLATSGQVMTVVRDLYKADGSLKRFALDESSKTLAALREYERKTGGHVAIFLLRPRERPRVRLQAVANPEVLTDEERDELETNGTLDSLRHAARGPRPTVLPVDVDFGSTYTESAGRHSLVSYSPILLEGSVYEYYTVYADDTSAEFVGLELDPLQSDMDMFERAVGRTAERYDGAAFLIGPTNEEPVALRIPKGISEDDLAEYMVLPQGAWSFSYYSIAPLTRRQSELLGGARWAATRHAAIPGDRFIERDGAEYTEPSLVFVAMYPDSPKVPLLWERYGKTPPRVLQVWLASNLSLIGGALGVLFLTAVVASPVAFLYERTVTQAQEIERERAKLRATARERVVERLTELSARVEAASTDVAERTRGEVASVASDIDRTIGELRSILGELAHEEAPDDE